MIIENTDFCDSIVERRWELEIAEFIHFVWIKDARRTVY